MFSFSCKTDGKSIVDGSNFKETILSCYKASNPGQIIALGLNCLPAKTMTPFIKSISREEIGVYIPIVAYPNSGEIYSKESSAWTPRQDDYSAEEYVEEWLNLGVCFIGGCCRTTSQDIQKITKEVKKWKSKQPSREKD